MRNWIALLIPPFLFGGLFLFNPNNPFLAIGLLIWMVTWWVVEIVPLGITSLVPIVFLPMVGIMDLKSVAAAYANPTIYLFLGGFIIARGLEKTQLSKRIALNILRLTGRSGRGIIFGFMAATAILSMWISNTATAVMMVPIALSVVQFLENQLNDNQCTSLKTFKVTLFLTIAYSANMGGILTPVGTPPNVVLLGFLEDIYKMEIDFWKWMVATLPIGLIVLIGQFFLLERLFPYNISIDSRFRHFVQKQIHQLGSLNKPQKITLWVFSFVSLLWILKGPLHYFVGTKFLNDTSIAIAGAILLFLLPTNKKTWKPVLNNEDISHLPWNIILLFGGGMAMAGALKKVGLIELSANYLITLNFGSAFAMVFILAAVTLLLTEVMSNVALCVVALPVFMELGVKANIPAVLIGMSTAICASMAFSMPISTPPNAIVFGTNMIEVKEMIKAGICLNVLGLITVMTIGWVTIQFFFC